LTSHLSLDIREHPPDHPEVPRLARHGHEVEWRGELLDGEGLGPRELPQTVGAVDAAEARRPGAAEGQRRDAGEGQERVDRPHARVELLRQGETTPAVLGEDRATEPVR